MNFEPYFKVHSLVSVHPESIILGQMTNLNMIFHVVVPPPDETIPSSERKMKVGHQKNDKNKGMILR